MYHLFFEVFLKIVHAPSWVCILWPWIWFWSGPPNVRHTDRKTNRQKILSKNDCLILQNRLIFLPCKNDFIPILTFFLFINGKLWLADVLTLFEWVLFLNIQFILKIFFFRFNVWKIVKKVLFTPTFITHCQFSVTFQVRFLHFHQFFLFTFLTAHVGEVLMQPPFP